MFNTHRIEALLDEANAFQVPVFLADRRPGDQMFKIVALNDEHERQSGLTMDMCAGRTLDQLLPDADAVAVGAKYSRAMRQNGPLRYRETLTLPEGEMVWDTTIRRIDMVDGTERVMGNAVCIRKQQVASAQQIAFDDITYFTREGQFQLARICAVMEAIEAQQVAPEVLHHSAQVMAGICRSIDQTLNDVRRAAEAEATPTRAANGYLVEPRQVTGTVAETAQTLVDFVKLRSEGHAA